MTRILVVDDDPLMRTAIQAWLEAENFEVVLAESARAGLKALGGTAFDLMITDIFMPDMEGLESIRTFRQRDPKMPIIAISGAMSRQHHGWVPDFLGMSTRLGATYCLRKPFKPRDLLQASNSVCRRHRGAKETGRACMNTHPLPSKHESWLHAVVDTAVDGVILIDARCCVLMFNPACEKLFGYAADEVIGQNVKILMPAPYRDEHDEYISNYHRTAERKIIGIGREVVGRRKDGSTFPMDLSVGASKQDGQSIFVGIIHDLTERERTELALRESAARLKAVVDTAVDGVILINAQGCVSLFNPACERLFGYRADEVIGQNVKILMPAPYRDEHDGYVESFRRTGERKIIGIGREVVGRRKDGSTFPMDLSVGEAKEAGESNFVGIIHDITDRKRTEEQLVQAQKMETVGQLSGGIAHDFNNLLTVIVGNAEFLSQQLKPRPDLQRLADDIERAGDRGAELTQRLLAFSRRQMLAPVEFDCNGLLKFMHELLRRTLREDIEIKMACDAELWIAFADPAQLNPPSSILRSTPRTPCRAAGASPSPPQICRWTINIGARTRR